MAEKTESPDQLAVLLKAARCGDVPLLSSLIDDGVAISSKSISDSGVFHIAYTCGHREFVYKLLEAGLNTEWIVIKDLSRSEECQIVCLRDVLWFKVYRESLKGNWKLPGALLNAGFKNDYQAISKYLRQSKSCWKYGASTGDRFNNVHSILLFLLARNSDCPSKMLQALVDRGADVNAIFHGFRICDYTVLCGNSSSLTVLLNNECLVDENDSGSFSSFHHSITFPEAHCLDLLLCNTDLSKSKIWRENGLELLILATKYGHHSCVDILLTHGASYEESDQNGLNDCPLHIACKAGNLTILDLLLKYGASVNVCGAEAETPLIYTAVFGHVPCLNALIASNADVNSVDCENQTALMHAIQRGHIDCVRLLLSAGADITVVNVNNETALTHAVSLSDKECLELVLSSEQHQSHIESFHVDKHHQEAFDLALRQYDVDALLVLLKYGLFSWEWIEDIKQEKVRTEIMARVLVASNIPPGHFHTRAKTGPKTLFQCALSCQDTWTACYLMANLYLDEHDFRPSGQQHILKVINKLQHYKNAHINALLASLVSQPMSLQVLCILNISSGLGFESGQKRRKREETIDRLPIPVKFKKVLNFQGPYSTLCVDKWKALGIDMTEKDLKGLMLAMKANRLNVSRCEEGQCGDNARGFRLRYDLLKKRTR